MLCKLIFVSFFFCCCLFVCLFCFIFVLFCFVLFVFKSNSLLTLNAFFDIADQQHINVVAYLLLPLIHRVSSTGKGDYSRSMFGHRLSASFLTRLRLGCGSFYTPPIAFKPWTVNTASCAKLTVHPFSGIVKKENKTYQNPCLDMLRRTDWHKCASVANQTGSFSVRSNLAVGCQCTFGLRGDHTVPVYQATQTSRK